MRTIFVNSKMPLHNKIGLKLAVLQIVFEDGCALSGEGFFAAAVD